MGLFKGALTVRRYVVEGEVPDDFRQRYADALNDHAFRDPPPSQAAEECAGWCQVHNLLDTDFTDLNRWLYNHYATFAIRVEKKVLPSQLFKAHLEKRVAAWCEEHQRERAPSSVRTEIKELLEEEMYTRTLPRVSVFEACWNIVDGWAILLNTSESANDRFRTLFRNTFGLTLEPFSPADFLADQPDLIDQLEVVGASDYRPEGAP